MKIVIFTMILAIKLIRSTTIYDAKQV